MSLTALGTREPRRGLVEHHELGLRDSSHPDLELALLTVGELGHHHVQTVREAHRLGHRAALVPQLRVGVALDEAEVAVVHAEHGQVEVVLDAEAAEQPRGLERARQSHPRPGAGGGRGDVPPQQLHRARAGRELPRDQVEQRRLPGAVRPQDRAPLSRAHRQVDVGDGDHAAEAPADPPKAEDRLGALGGSRGGGRHFPNETSSALPTHGGGSRFSHFGLLRSGAGLSALKKPPNV